MVKYSYDQGLERHCKLQTCYSDWKLTWHFLVANIFKNKKEGKKAGRMKKHKKQLDHLF